MKSVHGFDAVFLHKKPIDGRKQINGLAIMVQTSMDLDPFSNAIFVFITRRRDTIKLLYWNQSGFALWVYRLEKEKFRWPNRMEDEVIELSSQQLSWLIEGYDIMRMRPHEKLIFSSVS